MINLSSYILTNEELSILQIGLKRGLATRPNQSSILAYTEDISEQIDTEKYLPQWNVFKNNAQKLSTRDCF